LKKKYEKKKPRPLKPAKGQPIQPPVADDNTWDFGGIPARDLKKNLGCG